MPRNKIQESTGKAQFLFLFCALYFSLSTFVYAQDQFVYNPKGKRNPFIPLVSPEGRLLKLVDKEEAEEDLSVEGIIYDDYGQSYAMVNGWVVKIGDEIGGYWVLKIEKNKVIFIKDGQPKEVKLKEEE